VSSTVKCNTGKFKWSKISDSTNYIWDWAKLFDQNWKSGWKFEFTRT